MATPELVAGGALQPLERHLQHQAEVAVGAHRAHRAEALDGVVADELVERFSSSSVKPK
jgi:hypothetical protein